MSKPEFLLCPICNQLKKRRRFTMSDRLTRDDGLLICHACQRFECVTCGLTVDRSMMNLATRVCCFCAKKDKSLELERIKVICQCCEVAEVIVEVWPGTTKLPKKTCSNCARYGHPSERAGAGWTMITELTGKGLNGHALDWQELNGGMI